MQRAGRIHFRAESAARRGLLSWLDLKAMRPMLKN
jgi:hypothetical protein